MSFADKMIKAYDTTYKVMVEDMKENVIGAGFEDLVRDIWEAFSGNGILTKVEYQPMDSFGGSVCIYFSTMPGGYFLRLWYSPKNQCYMSGIFKHIVGNIAHLIPETFNAEGVFRIKSLDSFTDHFVTMMVKEKYNMDNSLKFERKYATLVESAQHQP